VSDQNLRITADELNRRMAAGEQFTIADVRNPQAWAAATDKGRGAIRIDLHSSETLPRLAHDKPIVAYCT